MFMAVIRMLATASRWVNRLAPSMRRKTPLQPRVFAARASPSSISPAFRSESIDICLPGSTSRVKQAVTSDMRTAPLVDDDVLNRDQHQENHNADDVVASHHKISEGFDHLSRRASARVA